LLAVVLLPEANSRRISKNRLLNEEDFRRETHISTQQSPPQEESRLPGSNEIAAWPRGPGAASTQRPQAALRLT
jgi:hypothetical protein